MTTRKTVVAAATSLPVNSDKPNSQRNHPDYVFDQDTQNSKNLDITIVEPTLVTPTHFSSISPNLDHVATSNTPRQSESEFPDIIAAIKRIQKGEYETSQTDQEFPLDSAQFSALQEEFERQDSPFQVFVETKLRYQYSSSLNRLTLQIPTLIHDFVSQLVSDKIREQLKLLGQNSDLKVANYIHLGASTNINLIVNGQATIYQPNQQFRFSVPGQYNPEFPAVVLETAFAQSVKRVATKSEEYIEGSEFNVNVVVAIKLSYQSLKDITSGKPYNQEARLYSFRKATNQNGEHVISKAEMTFRDKDGGAVGGTGDGLSILLSEFLPRREQLPQHENVKIFVSCHDLFHILHYAEEEYKNLIFRRATRNTPPPRAPRALSPLPLPSHSESPPLAKKRRASTTSARWPEDRITRQGRGGLPDELKNAKHHTGGNAVEADMEEADHSEKKPEE